MSRIRPHLSYSNVVSTLCLFALLGGGAYAALKVPKDSVGTKQLKNNAVKGSKVADGSLAASDIGGPVDSATEAAHAKVADNATNADQATHADNADNAAKADQAVNSDALGGSPSSAFFPSSRVGRVHADVTQASGSSTTPLLTMGPLTLTMACNRGANETVGINASSTASNASIEVGITADAAPTTSASFVTLTSAPSGILSRTDSGTGQSGAGELVYSDSNTTIAVPFRFFVSTIFNRCLVSGVAVQS